MVIELLSGHKALVTLDTKTLKVKFDDKKGNVVKVSTADLMKIAGIIIESTFRTAVIISEQEEEDERSGQPTTATSLS